MLCGTKLILFLTLAVYLFLLSSASSKVPALGFTVRFFYGLLEANQVRDFDSWL